MADGKEVFEITHRVNENALTVVELESRLSHLSAVNEKLKQTVRNLLMAGHDLASITECFCMDLSDQRGLSRSCETCLWVEAEKLADEMGEGK